jgi:DNA-binding CsgD family transcriptional regulator
LGARALALARELGDAHGELHALTAVTTAEYLADVEGKREPLERTVQRVEEAGLEALAASAYCTLAYGAFIGRRHTDAARYVQAGVDHCAKHDLDGWRPFLLGVRAEVELRQGRWSDAVDTAAEILVIGSGNSRIGRGVGPATTLALTVLGRVRARRGDPEVWSALDEALTLAEGTGQLLRLRPVAAARAEAAWLEGRVETIPEALSAALALAEGRPDRWVVGELAFWRWRAGMDDEIPARAAEPYAAQMAGDWRRAADLWAELGCPYENALALADADDDEALRRALELLQELGARPAAAMVARRLRERGATGVPRGPRARTRQNEANLTARQVEVLALLREGLRNAEIAERLFLSEKTVDHHVSAILQKLGVQSRGQAAAEAARLGMT